MKKIVLTIMLLAMTAMGAMAQKPVTKSVSGGKTASATDKIYTFNENGVDVLVMNQKFRIQPPVGSIYDKAVKKWVSDFGSTHYELKKNGASIGEAIVGEGKLEGLYVTAKTVQLDNGIKVGDLLFSAMGKAGVSAVLGSFDMDSDELSAIISYGDIEIIVSDPNNFSASGKKKKVDLEKKMATWDSSETPDQPTANLTKDDFDLTVYVVGFSLGIKY